MQQMIRNKTVFIVFQQFLDTGLKIPYPPETKGVYVAIDGYDECEHEMNTPECITVMVPLPTSAGRKQSCV